MPTLHLGVLDVAYSNDSGAVTTGQVAEFLEADYHVMRVFFETNQERIGEWLAQSMSSEIENLAMGKPPGQLSVNTEKINERFRDFLAQREWKDVSMQMIAAAEAGDTRRKQSVSKKGRQARAEFIDTGLYQQSFRAWVD